MSLALIFVLVCCLIRHSMPQRFSDTFDCTASWSAHDGILLSSVIHYVKELDEYRLITGGNDGAIKVRVPCYLSERRLTEMSCRYGKYPRLILITRRTVIQKSRTCENPKLQMVCTCPWHFDTKFLSAPYRCSRLCIVEIRVHT